MACIYAKEGSLGYGLKMRITCQDYQENKRRTCQKLLLIKNIPLMLCKDLILITSKQLCVLICVFHGENLLTFQLIRWKRQYSKTIFFAHFWELFTVKMPFLLAAAELWANHSLLWKVTFISMADSVTELVAPMNYCKCLNLWPKIVTLFPYNLSSLGEILLAFK